MDLSKNESIILHTFYSKYLFYTTFLGSVTIAYTFTKIILFVCVLLHTIYWTKQREGIT